jgi:hypothetical protein
MSSNNQTSQAKSKSRITKEQAAAFVKKSAPMDAEDKADNGADEASENGGKLKFGSPEWRAKYGRKSKTVSDALSAPMKESK